MSGKRGVTPNRFPFRTSHKAKTLGVVAAVAAGILSLEAVGTASAETLDTVSLTVDSVTTSVETGATTVGALLNERGMTLDTTDSVTPGRATAITDGMSVTVDHGALVTVIDDEQVTEHVVSADTATALASELELPQPHFVQVAPDTLEGYSYRRTVVVQDGEPLDANDRVDDGAQAVVQDVRVGFPDFKRDVNFRVVRDYSKLVPAGTRRVKQEGRDGVRLVTLRRVFVEGALRSERVAERTWVRAPRRHIVKLGSGPNWYGLARCESGGNVDAYNPAGYYGLYQFSLATWRSVGGVGRPTDYGYWEQTLRAWKLYQRSGASPWPHCGRYL